MPPNNRWYHNYSVTYNVLDHTEIQSMCVIYRTRVDPLFRACWKSEMRIRSACPAASYARVSQHLCHVALLIAREASPFLLKAGFIGFSVSTLDHGEHWSVYIYGNCL